MHVWRTAMALVLVAAACTDRPAPLSDPSDAAPSQVAASAHGVVVAGQPLAAAAGAEMLERGGNAVDAAVAAAFALSVVEPSMSGLGGRVQMLVRMADGRYAGIDGTTQAPATYDPDTAPQASYGYPTVGVPGVPAGLLKALDQYGTLDRATVMAPAIRLAEEGFELLPGEATRHAAVADRLVEFEGTRGTFLKPDSTTWGAGERFVQPDLARTLRLISAEGADVFYRGEIAARIAADIQANGGAVTEASLAAYQALDSEVLTSSYRGLETAGLWLPSYGAITLEILNLLETLPVSEFDEDDWATAITEAIRVAYLDRPNQRSLDDGRRLISKSYAASRAAAMRLPQLTATASLPTGPAPRPTPGHVRTAAQVDIEHTTHLSAADGNGMMVALTQSLGPNMGSMVVTPGLGFLYAATLGGYLGRMEPGERAQSHMSPTMLVQDGVPLLALGAAGGGRIPTAIIAAVSRLVDQNLSLADALAAPRVAPDTPSMRIGGDPDAPTIVQAEIVEGLGFSAAVLDSLAARGFEIETITRTGAFGRIHAVRWHPDQGVWEGVADPDWEGAAVTPALAGAGR
jgi:gamma-glutamyltranspeptidase/glutathione hydrolase